MADWAAARCASPESARVVTATADPHAASAVTVLVSRRVKPSHEAAFEQASEAMTAAAVAALLPELIMGITTQQLAAVAAAALAPPVPAGRSLASI